MITHGSVKSIWPRQITRGISNWVAVEPCCRPTEHCYGADSSSSRHRFCMCFQVSSSGLFQVQLLSLQNDNSLTADGSSCVGTTSTAERPAQCRTFLHVCLTNYQTVQMLADSTDDFSEPIRCEFAEATSPVLSNISSFQFPEVDNDTRLLNEDKLLILPFTILWPVSLFAMYSLMQSRIFSLFSAWISDMCTWSGTTVVVLCCLFRVDSLWLWNRTTMKQQPYHKTVSEIIFKYTTNSQHSNRTK
jgi:hypothetical protein